MDFIESKKEGDKFENEILSQIELNCNLSCKLNDDTEKFKEFDIITSNNITIECKHDLQFQNTGNFAIETHCNDNNSGILTTKADYWILGNLEYVYVITTENLNRCISENYIDLLSNEEPPKFIHFKNFPVQQSDNNIKRMSFYLIPIKILKEYANDYGPINEINYVSLFCNI